MAEFLTDIQTLRQRARQQMDEGPITEAYGADRDRVPQVLNEATELVCVLRYERHYYMASGLNAGSAASEFLQHATEEQQHADMAAQRIVQLPGEPDFNPETLTMRSHAEYVEGQTLNRDGHGGPRGRAGRHCLLPGDHPLAATTTRPPAP